MIRYHSLDALRAFALLLGVVFHAGESFMAGHYDWAIVDCAPSTALAIFRFACHSFRLEIFFLIAGFFACLLYERRGWREFARNRFQRIFVPLLVGWTILYGYCFVLGWLLYRQTDLLDSVARQWQVNLALGVALVLPTWAYLHYVGALGLPPGLQFWSRLGHATLYALMMWGLVLGITGLFVQCCRAQRPVWRYVADSSYWIYLVHIPLIVSLQILIAYVDLPWPPKFLAINLVAFPLLLLSYHYLVRSTPIGVQLNGRKYPFVPLRSAWASFRSRHKPQQHG